MEWMKAVQAFPGWSDIKADLTALRGKDIGGEPSGDGIATTRGGPPCAAAGEEVSVSRAPPSLCDLFAVQPLPWGQSSGDGAKGQSMIFILKSQVQDSFTGMVCSQVTIEIFTVSELSTPSTDTRATPILTLNVEVPGYDVKSNCPFRQLQVCASGKGVLLVAPRCCAGVAVPEIDETRDPQELSVRAVPLVPPASMELVKVQWHPLSDAHIGVLLSDNTWQLLNIAHRVSILDPEVSLTVVFDGDCEPGEHVADFAFGMPSSMAPHTATSGSSIWLAVAVFFLSSRGKMSVCSPVLPSLSVFPVALLETLRAPCESGHLEAQRGTQEAAKVDHVKSISALTEAIAVLKKQTANVPPASSLLQVVSGFPRVQAATKRAIENYLAQSGPNQEANAYERQQKDMVAMLEEARDKFIQESSDMEKQDDSATRWDAHEWLRSTLSCSANRRTVSLPGAPATYCSVRHSLHLHGDCEAYFRRWTPAEQAISEEGERHHRNNYSYCSLQIVSHYPVTVVARATTTGVVETLILSRAVAPQFERRDGFRHVKSDLACTVFEEVDLAPNPTKSPVVNLSMAPILEENNITLIARTRTLVAAIELPWLTSLHTSAVELLPQANVTTLIEGRAADGPCEIVGWQLASPGLALNKKCCVGLALRAHERAASAVKQDAAGQGSLQTIDIGVALKKAATKATTSKEAHHAASASATPAARSDPLHSCADSDREEYRQYVSTPLVLPSQVFGVAGGDGSEPPTAGAVARAVANVQGGQVAALSARQTVLKDISEQAPARMKKAMLELGSLRKSAEQIRQKTSETEKNVKRIHERQSELDEQFTLLAKTLNSQLECLALNSTAAEELPSLWSQLHDLRQAFELLRAAAAPDNPQELARRDAGWFSKVEQLQRTWTNTTADALRAQALDAEALADKAVGSCRMKLRNGGDHAVAG